MQQFQTDISYWVPDECPNFFRKLKRYVGNFRVVSSDNQLPETFKIIFWTDKIKVEVKEGDRIPYAELIAKTNSRRSWYFIDLKAR